MSFLNAPDLIKVDLKFNNADYKYEGVAVIVIVIATSS